LREDGNLTFGLGRDESSRCTILASYFLGNPRHCTSAGSTVLTLSRCMQEIGRIRASCQFAAALYSPPAVEHSKTADLLISHPDATLPIA
jgi:hypothetical protein